MKRQVWLNKSNNQLCVTVPKGSGILEGDVVTLEKATIKRVVYSSVTADLFHYGHLQLLEKASEQGDIHVCGVLTNEAIESYKKGPVADLKERKAIISALRCVDMMMTQKSLDPTQNLKELHEQFPSATIILVFGSNWNPVPGREYIESIGGEIVQPAYYEKLSSKKVIKKLEKMYEEVQV